MTRRIDIPEPGYFLVRLANGAMPMPARIYRPCPLETEPETWQWIDRYSPLQAEIAGEPVPVERIWPMSPSMPGKTMIERAREYSYRMAVKAWAEQHDPTAPEANPRQAIDHLTTRVVF